MTWEIVVGLTIILGALLSIMGVVVKVNGTLTRLDEAVRNLQSFIEKQDVENNETRKILGDHETRITILERKD